jgi:hypothetical protein
VFGPTAGRRPGSQTPVRRPAASYSSVVVRLLSMSRMAVGWPRRASNVVFLRCPFGFVSVLDAGSPVAGSKAIVVRRPSASAGAPLRP